MPLTRVASGLLARHEAGSSTHPFSVADWDVPSGVTVSVDAQGRLVLSYPSAVWRHIHHRHVPSRTRVFTQSLAARTSGIWGGDAAHADAGGTNHVRIQWSYGRPQGELIGLAQNTGNTETTIAQGVRVPARASGVDYRFSLWVDGAEVVGYDHDNALTISGTSTTHTSGGVGCALGGGSSGRRYSAYYVMADRYLRVYNLPPAYRVRVGGAVGVADSDGLATVDLLTVPFPQAVIEVLDESGAVVESIAPEDGVWGGDVYEAGPRPDRPTITVVEPWINPVTLSGSPFSITGGGYADVVQSDNPVAYWRLGEPAGATVAVDSVGGHHGVYEGAPVTGVPGLVSGSDTAADLSAGSVRVPGTEALRPAEVTIEAWFRPSGFIPSTPNHIAQHANAYILETNQVESARPQLAFFTGSGFLRITAPDPMEVGEVYHLVGTYDGEVARLYVNGVEVASDILGGIAYGEDDFFISQASPTSLGVLGVVDEVAVYAHALSPERVVAHYDAGRAHLASRWQVALATDPEFTAPIFDSGWDTEHLLEITIDEQLPAGVPLLARVAYRHRNGRDSEWSVPAEFVVAGWIPCPAPPNTEWEACPSPDVLRLEVDVDARLNGAANPAVGLAVGITIDGFQPDETLVVRPNFDGPYIAYSPWGKPERTGPDTGSHYRINVVKDGDPSRMEQYDAEGGPFDGYEAARRAFVNQFPNGVSLTGAASYTFYIQDTPVNDNTGGVSLVVERQTWEPGPPAPVTPWEAC